MFEATETTEVVTTPADGEVTVEEVTEANNSNNVVTDVEEPAEELPEVEEPVVEEPTLEEVSVEAIDGYTAYVNSQLQFRVSGDDVVINGLDGMDYSFDGEILTINTGADATVLTVEVSNAISSQTFDVNINGIVG